MANINGSSLLLNNSLPLDGELLKLALMPKRNELKEIRNYKQLEKTELDFDSPRLKKAMYNLGVSKEECVKK